MCRWAVAGSAHFYTLRLPFDVLRVWALSRDLEVGQRERLARGRSPGPGCPHRANVDSWAAQRGGHPRCAQPAWPGPGGCWSFPPALELGWGPGLGSTRPLLERLPGCCCGLGPGVEGSASPVFTENSLCAGAVLGKRGVRSKQSPRPGGPIVWGQHQGSGHRDAWMVAVA